MFIITVPDNFPQTESGQCIAQEVELKTIPDSPQSDYCLCDLGLSVCDYEELSFYNGSNKYENDYTSLFVNKVDTSDIIEFYAVNKKTGEEFQLTDLNSSTYGIYSEDDNHIGINIDTTTFKTNNPTWTKFYLRVSQNVFGEILSFETHTYNMVQWDEERANGTVRMEVVQNGYIESGNNYGSLNWMRSVRIKGKFGDFKPEFEADNYMDGNRIIKQIQDKVIKKYTLETELIPQSIMNMIALNDVFANEIIISDYNIKNANYKGVSVVPENIDTTYYEKNPNGSYEIEFKAKKENDIKHNV